MATFEFKAEGSETPVGAIGWSDSEDPDFTFGVLESDNQDDVESYARITGIYATYDAENRPILNVLVQGPGDAVLNYPSAFAITALTIVIPGNSDDPPETFNLDGSAAKIIYEPTGNLGSTAASDARMIWQWDAYGLFDLLDLETYTVELTMQEIANTGFNCECDDDTNNETLAELREQMMIRLGFAAQLATPPPGMTVLLNNFLITAQKTLYRRFEALRTERFFTWALATGTRYYDLPENMDICSKPLDTLKITAVHIQDVNGAWTPLNKGIPPTLYTGSLYYGMPFRYEIRQCIEVFPAPNTRYLLRVKGMFGLSAFAADDDKTTIDSTLVFLWALGTAKAHYGQPDANDIKAEANTYRLDLIAGKHQTRRYIPGTTILPSVPQPVFLPLLPGGEG